MNSRNKSIFWAALTIAILTFIVYIPALNNGFVDMDDGGYVYENTNIKSLDLNFLKWIFTLGANATWHPLTLFSLALDYATWGLNPFGYHLSNNLFHALNSSLAFIFVNKLIRCGLSWNKKPYKHSLTPAVITALLFGLHPLRVESVAWISERKDLLNTFFSLLSLLTYMEYSLSRSLKRRVLLYILCFTFFVLALLSKPMAVMLPAVFLILDFYPLRRIVTKNEFVSRLLIGKIPFFLLSSLTAIMAIMAQDYWGALVSMDVYPLMARIHIAVRGYLFYIIKMLIPVNLSPYYPYPNPIKVSLFDPEYLCSYLFLLLITLFCVKKFKKEKVYFFAWLYYLLTLLPVIGFIKVGRHAVADRYTYLPSLGVFLIIGLGSSYLLERYANRLQKGLVLIVLAISLGIFTTLTIKQTFVWKDSITLWSQVIRIFHDEKLAYNNRGNAYHNLGSHQEAIKDYNKATELDLKYAYAYYNRGMVYYDLGDYQQAKKDFHIAIELNSRDAESHQYLGLIYSKLGLRDTALYYFKRAESLVFHSKERLNTLKPNLRPEHLKRADLYLT